MGIAAERLVVNDVAERVEVLPDMADYLELLDAAEELESIRAFDATTSGPSIETMPFEQAVREIEHVRERGTPYRS